MCIRSAFGCCFGGACNLGFFGFLFWGFNFASFLFGATMLGLGIWMLVEMPYMGDYSESMENVLICVITLGAVIFAVGFLGCCSITKENSCMLRLYSIIGIGIIAVQITLIFLAEFLVGPIDTMEATMLEHIENFDNLGYEDGTARINELQEWAQCCGASSWTEYVILNDNFEYNNTVPASCCDLGFYNDDIQNEADALERCLLDALDPDTNTTLVDEETPLRTQGCVNAWDERLAEFSDILIITMSIFSIAQAVGILFACCLQGKMSKKAAVGTV